MQETQMQETQMQETQKPAKQHKPNALSIRLFFIVAFRSAKEWENATFAERKATLIRCTMLNRTIGASLFFESANVNKQFLYQHCIASPTIYQADMWLLYPALRTHPFRCAIRPVRTRRLSSP